MSDAAADLLVLVVDDEPLTAAAHASYVERLPGFRTVAIAATATAAVIAVRSTPIDLVLLDMNMPDATGIDVARRIRAEGHDLDIIAVTAVREAAVIRQAVSLGIVHYLLKPFTFQVFAEKLQALRAYRAGLADAVVSGQHEVDQTIGALRQGPLHPSLPKGLTADTLARVVSALRERSGSADGDARAGGAPAGAAPAGVSAKELADQLTLSRVTARRYLEYLTETGAAERSPRYGTPGRPELEYRQA